MCASVCCLDFSLPIFFLGGGVGGVYIYIFFLLISSFVIVCYCCGFIDLIYVFFLSILYFLLFVYMYSFYTDVPCIHLATYFIFLFDV